MFSNSPVFQRFWHSGMSWFWIRSIQVLFVAGKKAEQRRKWFLLGRQVSPTCCLALLGMGNDRLNRIMQHRLDMRRSFGKETRHHRTHVSEKQFLSCWSSSIWWLATVDSWHQAYLEKAYLTTKHLSIEFARSQVLTLSGTVIFSSTFMSFPNL